MNRLLLFAALLSACGATAADAAHLTALAWNTAGRPAMKAAYVLDQRRAVDRVCPAGPCDAAVMAAAVAPVRAAWARVYDAEEAAGAAHDVWRRALERCRADAGACAADLPALGADFAARQTEWRCAIRAVGHPELDALPGTATCATPADGGTHE